MRQTGTGQAAVLDPRDSGIWARSSAFLQRNSRPGGLLWTRTVNRRVGAMIAIALMPTRISSNWISVAGLTVHVAGAAYVAFLETPSPLAIIPAVVLWQLAFSLDCTDGMLARERGDSTRFGAWLDQVMDFLAHVAVFTALVIYVTRAIDLAPVHAVLLAVLAAGGNLLQLFAASQRNTIMGLENPGDQPPTWRRRSLMLGRHLIDYGAFLFLAAILLLAPIALLILITLSGSLAVLAVLAQVILNWKRYSHAQGAG